MKKISKKDLIELGKLIEENRLLVEEERRRGTICTIGDLEDEIQRLRKELGL